MHDLTVARKNARTDADAAAIAWAEGCIEALRHVLIGGNHVALLIGSDHPPYAATHDEAREHYEMQEQYEAWCCWRTVMYARDALGETVEGAGL